MPRPKCKKGSRQAAARREESQIKKDLEKRGYQVRKQPGSGNRDITLQHDIWWGDSPAGKLLIEDKYRTESGWKTLEKWKQGADILTMRCAGGQRMAFLSWELLLALIGDAAIRDDLSALEAMEPEKAWLAECLSQEPQDMIDRAHNWMEESDRRARIQSAHQNPKPKPAKPRKLRSRGFGK